MPGLLIALNPFCSGVKNPVPEATGALGGGMRDGGIEGSSCSDVRLTGEGRDGKSSSISGTVPKSPIKS
jgi:hypothetical protein